MHSKPVFPVYASCSYLVASSVGRSKNKRLGRRGANKICHPAPNCRCTTYNDQLNLVSLGTGVRVPARGDKSGTEGTPTCGRLIHDAAQLGSCLYQGLCAEALAGRL
jgi:hypothetical protein